MAIHSPVGDPFWLTCINRASAKILWKSKVWGTCWKPLYINGLCHMRAAVEEKDGHVIVFGSSTFGLHVEVFRSDNGENLFRFCTACTE